MAAHLGALQREADLSQAEQVLEVVAVAQLMGLLVDWLPPLRSVDQEGKLRLVAAGAAVAVDQVAVAFHPPS